MFIWSDRTIKEVEAKGGCLKSHQLNVEAYLWELVYELLLSGHDDVSESPGFESLGLRVKNKIELTSMSKVLVDRR